MRLCTPSMESSHLEFPVGTEWLDYKLGTWPPRVVFLLFSAHITDLQTCVKFTRAVNVTYCKRWK